MKCWVIGCEKMHRVMWGEVDTLEDAAYVDGIFLPQRPLTASLQRRLIELGKKNRLPGFLKKFAYRSFTLNALDYDEEDNYIILTDNRVGWYPLEYLKMLQEKYRVRYVLVYLNPYSVSGREVYAFQEIADIVFSYDKKDVEKYGFEPFITVFSGLELPAAKKTEWDIVYCGGENGRLKELLECFGAIEESGVSYDFSIVGTKEENRKYADKIHYREPMDYEEIVEKEAKSNVILEVLSSKQTGTTARSMEAVKMNKKFVTNNASLAEMPFYDPRYMQIFKDPKEIDFEFVKRREEVKYNYHGECSPVRIIERIREIYRSEHRFPF